MDIFELLKMARQRDASDLQLIVDSPPLMRVYGTLAPVDELPALTTGEVYDSLVKITSKEERDRFASDMEIDFAYTQPDIGRLRCNAAQQLSGVSLAIRLLPQILTAVWLPSITKGWLIRSAGHSAFQTNWFPSVQIWPRS